MNSRGLTARSATAGDAAGIRDLLRDTPFGTRIRFTLEEDPHGGTPTDRHDRRHTILFARKDAPDEIVGLASRSVHRLWLNGRPAEVGYLGQLRARPGNRVSLRRLREGFHLLDEQRRPGETTSDYTSILDDNLPARRLLERGLPGLPRYEPIAGFVTLSFSPACARRRDSQRVNDLQAREHDEAVAFLNRHLQCRNLAPRVDAGWFVRPDLHWWIARDRDRIVACGALWDRRGFRSIRVRGYDRRLRLLRHPVNLVRLLRRSPLLPPAGAHLPLAFLSFLAADDEDHLASLVAAAARRARERSIGILHLGLPDGHVALPMLVKTLRPEVMRSTIYWVHPPSGPEAVLDDTLPTHPEAALL